MYTKGPSARHPLQLQQSSFHKPKPDPPTPSHCLINPSQLTLPLSTNKGEPTMWPEVRGLLQPATKNRPEREGNPGPDQLLLQISMKNTDNSFLRQTIRPIIIGWINVIGIRKSDSKNLNERGTLCRDTTPVRYTVAILIGFSCSAYSHPRFEARCPCVPPWQQEKMSMFDYVDASV